MTKLERANSLYLKNVDLVEKLVVRFTTKNTKGYLTAADVAQEIRLIILKSLAKYRPCKGKLENYLSHVLYKRTLNFQRNMLRKTDLNTKRSRCKYWRPRKQQCKLAVCLCEQQFKEEATARINIVHPISLDNQSTPIDDAIDPTMAHDFDRLVELRDQLLTSPDKYERELGRKIKRHTVRGLNPRDQDSLSDTDLKYIRGLLE